MSFNWNELFKSQPAPANPDMGGNPFGNMFNRPQMDNNQQGGGFNNPPDRYTPNQMQNMFPGQGDQGGGNSFSRDNGPYDDATRRELLSFIQQGDPGNQYNSFYADKAVNEGMAQRDQSGQYSLTNRGSDWLNGITGGGGFNGNPIGNYASALLGGQLPPPTQPGQGGRWEDQLNPLYRKAMENDPEAMRQLGWQGSGPQGAPDYVTNPTSAAEWQQRYLWLGGNQTPVMTGQLKPDYSQPGQVRFNNFAPNFYAAANAQRQFNELSGQLDEQKYGQARQMGWQVAGNPFSDYNSAYMAGRQLAGQNTGNDYSLVNVGGNYALMMRPQNYQAAPPPQQLPPPRGYAGGGGGGAGYRPAPRPYQQPSYTGRPVAAGGLGQAQPGPTQPMQFQSAPQLPVPGADAPMGRLPMHPAQVAQIAQGGLGNLINSVGSAVNQNAANALGNYFNPPPYQPGIVALTPQSA